MSEGSGSQDPGKDESLKRRRTTSEHLQENMVAASPPKYVSVEEIMKTAKNVNKMMIAHEIALSENFHLEKRPETNLESQVKSIAQKAFWDVLKEDLQGDVKIYDRALILLQELKESLLGLLMPHHTRTRLEISEVLDIDLISQQAEKGTLDFLHYGRYIISVMAKLCAPVRDEKIRELAAESDLVQMYRGIFDVLQLMLIDYANFTIQAFRPHIQQHSVEYERQKFKEFLETQDDGLRYTKEWLSRHNPVPSSDLGEASGRRMLANRILTNAYLELLEWKDENPFPETLLMDQHRFLELRTKAVKLEILASVMLVVAASVQNAVVTTIGFRDKLKQHSLDILGDDLPEEDLTKRLQALAQKIASDVNEEFSSKNLAALSSAAQDLLLKGVEDLSRKDNRIRALIRTRMKEFLYLVLSSSSASRMEIPPGLNCVQVELTDLTGKFTRLVSYNKSVFEEFYSDIIEKNVLNLN